MGAQIYRRAASDRAAVGGEPLFRLRASGCVQVIEQFHVRMDLRPVRQDARVRRGLDEVEPVLRKFSQSRKARTNGAAHGFARHFDDLDIADQRRIEGKAVDVRLDLSRPGRQAFLLQGRELYDQRIGDGALHRERHEIGVGGKAAVPVRDAVDFHGVMQRRQAGGGQHSIDRQFIATEQAGFAGGDFSRRNQQFHGRVLADRCEIDRLIQEPAQRIEAQRIEFVRRPQGCEMSKRCRARQREQHGVQAQELRHAGFGDSFPDLTQLGARAFGSIFCETRC